MLNFQYKGISQGKYVEGEIEALNNSEAAYKLKEQKVIITKLIEAKKKKVEKEKKRVVLQLRQPGAAPLYPSGIPSPQQRFPTRHKRYNLDTSPRCYAWYENWLWIVALYSCLVCIFISSFFLFGLSRSCMID